MRKFFSYSLLAVVIMAILAAWLILGSGTGFITKNAFFTVDEGKVDRENVLATLDHQSIVNSTTLFGLVANAVGVWDNIKPGKYEVKRGQSLLSIARMLKNNRQAEIKLVINKLRTKADLAKLISKNFLADSMMVMSFINNNDSLKPFGVDSNTVMSMVIPNTYSYYYTASMSKILDKLYKGYQHFWNDTRKQQAQKMGFSPIEIITIASIVEEETNKQDEKGNIASVYINRLTKKMALGADPTIKFALNDFALKRILYVHLNVASPYNTYRNKGLPPGPICTPSAATIDAVLTAPATNYLYFVADASLNGYHHFSENFAEHVQYAKQYQQALDRYQQNR